MHVRALSVSLLDAGPNLNQLLFVVVRKIQLGHLQRVRFAFPLREREDDDGVVPTIEDHPDEFEDVAGALRPRPALLQRAAALLGPGTRRAAVLVHAGQRLLEVVLLELASVVHHQVQAFTARREHVVLQRGRLHARNNIRDKPRAGAAVARTRWSVYTTLHGWLCSLAIHMENSRAFGMVADRNTKRTCKWVWVPALIL